MAKVTVKNGRKTYELSEAERQSLQIQLKHAYSDEDRERLAFSANQLGTELTNTLGSSEYRNTQQRVDTQRQMNTYERLLGQLGAMGYDTAQAKSTLPTMRNIASAQVRAFSPFSSKDEYDSAVQYAYDVENLDMGKAWAELDAWKQERTDFENLSPAEMSRYISKHGETLPGYEAGAWYDPDNVVRDYDRRITERQQYLHGIQGIRDLRELGGVVDNEDFAENSAFTGNRSLGVGSKADRTYLYINDPEYREDYSISRNMSGGMSTFDPAEIESIEQMTPDEVAVFNYYYNTQGEDAAMNYLDHLTSTIRQRKAAERFEELEGRPVAEIAFGVGAGLDQFASGLQGLVSREAEAPSWRQYASGMVREDLGNVRLNPDSKDENSIGQYIYDATTSGANMLPSILASSVANFIAPGSGAVVGAVTMGASASGNAYQEMLNLGYDKLQSRAYSTLVGASEAALSYLLGGITSLGGTLPKGITGSILKNVDNAVARIAIQYGSSLASEFTEEYLQEVLTPVFQNMILRAGNDISLLSSDALYSGILGALTAGLMEGGGVVGGAMQTSSTGKQILGSEVSVEDLKALAATMDNLAVRELADRTTDNSGAYQVGRLYEEVSEAMPGQRKADASAIRREVIDQLNEYGITGRDANTIADAAVARASGNELTRSQRRLLDAFPELMEIVDTAAESDTARGSLMRELAYSATNARASAKPSEAPTATQQNTPPTTQEVRQNAPAVNRRDTSPVAAAIAERTGMNTDLAEMIADNTTPEQSAEDVARAVAYIADHATAPGATADTVVEKVASAESVAVLTDSQRRLAAEVALAQQESTKTQRQLAYDIGYALQPMEDALSNKRITIPRSEVEAAYNEGYQAAQRKAESGYKYAPKTFTHGSVRVEGDADSILSSFNTAQTEAYSLLETLAKVTGTNVVLYESTADETGNITDVQGEYNPADPNTVRIDVRAGIRNISDIDLASYTMLRTFTHEFVHSLEIRAPKQYADLKRIVFAQMRQNGANVTDLIEGKIASYGVDEDGSYRLSYNDASHEVLADSLVDVLPQTTFIETLAAKNKTLFDRILSGLKEFLARIKAHFAAMSKDTLPAEARKLMNSAMQYTENVVAAFDRAAVAAVENAQSRGAEGTAVRVAANADVQLDPSTDSAAPIRNSLRTWTESEYVYARDAAAKVLAKQLDITEKQATTYIDNINGIAALIADDKVRLDYEPNMDIGATVLKSNQEYKFTVDMSTLCSKRLLFTGTFDAIQKALPNTVFDSDDIVNLRKMMVDRGLEVACGICYVESTRREIGRITQDFIERYKLAQKTGNPITRVNSEGKEVVLKSEGRTFLADPDYTPTLANLNTTDIDLVKRDHREVYDAYLAFMNARGQAKPKLLETRAEYKGEILRSFKAKSAVNARNAHGGLRLQSFSDFEVPHMIDMMQVILDMSRVGLKSQAYTKVPAFAEVFGGTGVKINLSLIAKGDGVDANGNLIFDDVEGMNHEDAFRIREMYSENVGTILVGKNDNHIIKAMADPRIDFIIPFHKSSWKESLYDALGLRGYDDYTNTQTEKPIDPTRGKIANFDPSEYWDFTKTGDENAQIYLAKCREDGRIPKFPQFQGYPGYWKLLIDFKMYDNAGNGVPQQIVKPEYNMEAATRILNEYKGGHRSFPVAQDVVNEFIESYRQKNENPTGTVRNQRREVLTDRDVIERTQAIVSSINPDGTVEGELYGIEAEDIVSFRDGLTGAQADALRIVSGRLEDLQDLQSQRREQGRLYRRYMFTEEGRNQAEAIRTRNRMDELDKRIEAAKASLAEAENAGAYKNLLRKARTLVEQTERGRIKTALDRYRDRKYSAGQISQKKWSIMRTAKDLNNLLYRGKKNRNVKQELRGVAEMSTELYDILFSPEMSGNKGTRQFNEAVVSAGFGVILSKAEQAHADEARKILADMRHGRTEELERKLAYRMGQLKEALERERERINGISVGDLFDQIANEYAGLRESGYDYIRAAYKEEVYEELRALKGKVGTTAARDMTLAQLTDLDKALKMVLNAVQNANTMFTEGKKQTVSQAGNRIIVEESKYKQTKPRGKVGAAVESFAWNNKRPVDAFESIGSDTLTDLFWNIRKGEDVWAVDTDEAKEYRAEQAEKYHFYTWDFDKPYTLKSTDGADFSITLEQLMSLYAYSKREQAIDHLLRGGVVLAGAEVIVNGRRRVNEDATAYAIPAQTLERIGEMLTEEQRGYVDSMQSYLSRELARKGNEISMKMYGVELFNEKNYFPINSSGIYLEKAEKQLRQKASGQINIENFSFTKSTAPKASNPVMLSGFSDVWANHVNEMAMYHAFVLPLEDFRRVRNFQTTTANGTKGEGVVSAIQNAHGAAAVRYLNQFIEDLNGGVVSDNRESFAKQLTAKFKRAATMASLSVIVQQISSLPRAAAILDAKYFAGKKVGGKGYAETLAEVRKYAPIMRIKERGHFDTGVGRSAAEYINAQEYEGAERLSAFFTDSGYRDEVLGSLPAKMDEIAWVAIWDACKREQHDIDHKADVNSAEFLEAVSERFTEVVAKTQVYDSTLSKSSFMRSKSALMGMVTSFLAEPTVTINMAINAIATRDNKTIRRTAGALLTSIIVNNIAASMVYAMRDDDEDEKYYEKWAQSFARGMVDDINPLTYLPWARDVWSMLQGFDIERADTSLISAMVDALKSFVRTLSIDTTDMTEEETKAHTGDVLLAGGNILLTVANAFGIPLRNVAREVDGVVNTVQGATSGIRGSARKFGEKLWQEVRAGIPILAYIPEKNSKTDKLYEAIVSGDEAYAERARKTYSSDTAYNNAVKKGLLENDPRIEEAARARMSGDNKRYRDLFREIEGEGRFDFDIIMSAINSAENALTPKTEKEPTEARENLFSIGNYYTAIAAGDAESAEIAYNELFNGYIAEGYLESEAKKNIESGFTSQVGAAYMSGEIRRDKAITMLSENTETHGEKDVKKWDFQMEYGYSWGSRDLAYRVGDIERNELITAYMDIEEATKEEAEEYVKELDFEVDKGYGYNDIIGNFESGQAGAEETVDLLVDAGHTEEEARFMVLKSESGYGNMTIYNYRDFTEFCQPAGIGVDTYMDYLAEVKGITGEGKKARRMEVIDSLRLTPEQKDALYFSEGWAESTIEEAPWH